MKSRNAAPSCVQGCNLGFGRPVALPISFGTDSLSLTMFDTLNGQANIGRSEVNDGIFSIYTQLDI